MTRYDYRFKRRVFRKTDYGKFKDFDGLQRRFASRQRVLNIVRSLIILLALILLIGVLIFTAKAATVYPSQTTKETVIHLPKSNP